MQWLFIDSFENVAFVLSNEVNSLSNIGILLWKLQDENRRSDSFI